LLEREHIGYIQPFDSTQPLEKVGPNLLWGGLGGPLGPVKGGFPMVVYLPELKLMTKFKCDKELGDYQCAKFKLYLFHDEDNLQRKIRVQLQA
jgi:hypothetical protein